MLLVWDLTHGTITLRTAGHKKMSKKWQRIQTQNYSIDLNHSIARAGKESEENLEDSCNVSLR